MSISIATMGMFNPCCGQRGPVVGGAPPYRQNYDEKVKPTISVTKFEMTSVSIKENILKNINVRLVNEDNQEE